MILSTSRTDSASTFGFLPRQILTQILPSLRSTAWQALPQTNWKAGSKCTYSPNKSTAQTTSLSSLISHSKKKTHKNHHPLRLPLLKTASLHGRPINSKGSERVHTPTSCQLGLCFARNAPIRRALYSHSVRVSAWVVGKCGRQAVISIMII